MFINVNESENTVLEGWFYVSQNGSKEYVVPMTDTIKIVDSAGDEVYLYKEDINNLIKALAAAKEYFNV